MSDNLHNLLNQEMDRKQFLLTIGLAIVSLLGISTIIHLLSGKHPNQNLLGYGSTDYGDKKARN